MSNSLATIENGIFDCEQRFNAVNAYKLNFKKEASFALQLISNPKAKYLLDTAIKNPASLENAISNLAAIGISLNPATKESYLVPRGGEVCLDITAIGLIKLATDSGSIKWAQAILVHMEDEFIEMSVGQAPIHKIDRKKPRGNVFGVYVVAKTHDGDFLVEFMTIEECHGIRNRSEAWKAFKAGKTNQCPWDSDEGEMMKKTVIKRAQKYWPKSQRVDEAIQILNQHEGIDFNKEQRGAFVDSPSADIVADDKTFKNIRDLLEHNKRTEDQLLKYINGKFKSDLKNIEDMEPAHIEEAYRAMGGK